MLCKNRNVGQKSKLLSKSEMFFKSRNYFGVKFKEIPSLSCEILEVQFWKFDVKICYIKKDKRNFPLKR